MQINMRYKSPGSRRRFFSPRRNNQTALRHPDAYPLVDLEPGPLQPVVTWFVQGPSVDRVDGGSLILKGAENRSAPKLVVLCFLKNVV